MAQIEDQDLVYQSQVTKSCAKLSKIQKFDMNVRHHPQNPKIFWKFFLNFLKINNYGAQRPVLVILCEFWSIWTNLDQNEWQKIEKIHFTKKNFRPLGGARLKFWWSEVLS